MQKLLKRIIPQDIKCLGTKYEVPNKDVFWRNLHQNASQKFYLVGKTNKSWFSKNREQTASFAESLFRVCNGGGKVGVISDGTKRTKDSTVSFFREYVAPYVNNLNKGEQELAITRLEENFYYGTHSNSNYRAIVSDKRLVFIPSLNSAHFKDDALVLEMDQVKSATEYDIWASDIERLLGPDTGESKTVDLDWKTWIYEDK